MLMAYMTYDKNNNVEEKWITLVDLLVINESCNLLRRIRTIQDL